MLATFASLPPASWQSLFTVALWLPGGECCEHEAGPMGTAWKSTSVRVPHSRARLAAGCASWCRCHWPGEVLGKLQGKWAVTQGLAEPLSVSNNATKSHQVSVLWFTGQQGSAGLRLLAHGQLSAALQAPAWVLSPAPGPRDHSVSLRASACRRVTPVHCFREWLLTDLPGPWCLLEGASWAQRGVLQKDAVSGRICALQRSVLMTAARVALPSVTLV